MASIWQKLGAWSGATENLADWQLDGFAQVGGKWLVPVITNDSATGPYNSEHFEALKARVTPRGVRLGSWHNYFGEETPAQFAAKVADFVHKHDAGPVFIDAEASVQGNTKLSNIMLECRKAMPTRNLAVTTNSLNDSTVYNGRIEGVPPELWKSAIDLGIRLTPQWYNSPAYGQRSNPWTTPDLNMAWLQEHGDEDNLHEVDRPGHFAVPLSYVHCVTEVTGLEGASLEGELHDLTTAKQYGYTFGFSIYLLENMLEEDLPRLAEQANHLFLV